jgi:hypothetical protein
MWAPNHGRDLAYHTGLTSVRSLRKESLEKNMVNPAGFEPKTFGISFLSHLDDSVKSDDLPQ